MQFENWVSNQELSGIDHYALITGQVHLSYVLEFIYINVHICVSYIYKYDMYVHNLFIQMSIYVYPIYISMTCMSIIYLYKCPYMCILYIYKYDMYVHNLFI